MPAGIGDIRVIGEGANNCVDDKAYIILFVQKDITGIFPDQLVKPKPKEPIVQMTIREEEGSLLISEPQHISQPDIVWTDFGYLLGKI